MNVFFEPKLFIKKKKNHREDKEIWRSCSVIASVVFEINSVSLNLTLFAYDVLLQQHDLSKAAQSSIFFETLRMSGWEKLYSALENEVLCWFFKKKNPPLILLNRTKEAKSRAVIVGFKSGERTASWQLCVMQKKKKKKGWKVNFDLFFAAAAAEGVELH